MTFVHPLEPRRLMTVTGSLDLAGDVQLVGDAGWDNLILGLSADGRSLTVDTFNGTSTHVGTFELARVRRIVFHAGDGNDSTWTDPRIAKCMFLYGEGGEDVLQGGAETDYLDGGAERDALWGAGGVDLLYGGAGNDIISGVEGNDYLVGGEGNDTLRGFAGDDYMSGGPGADTVSYDDRSFGHACYITAVHGSRSGEVHGITQVEFDTIWDDVETYSGGHDDDTIVGNDGPNTIRGGEGNDWLFGADGADRIYGDAGDDRIFGGLGSDVLIGDDGNDEFFDRDGDFDFTQVYGDHYDGYDALHSDHDVAHVSVMDATWDVEFVYRAGL